MKKYIFAIFIVLILNVSIFSFDKGFTLGLRANFSGSYTDPHISKQDMDYLGAKFMKGMLGFVMSGEAELTYIFEAKRYFNFMTNHTFGGLGLAFNIGVGSGFSGQISGSVEEGIGNIDVYCRVFMSPVLNFGTSIKTYFMKNRLALSFTLGGKVPLDPDPTYELYTNLSEEKLKELKKSGPDFYPETGTLVVSDKMMKKINPIGFSFKIGLAYNQPVIETMELTIGTHLQYCIYKPKYVIMPKKIVDAAKGKNKNIDFERDPIKSFYMNNLDFGLSLGLLFKV